MKTAFWTFTGILAGSLAAFILVIAVEAFSSVVHPFPEDFEGTKEEICQHVERYPPWVLAVFIPAWAATALVGVWIAQRIGNLFSSATVGLLLFAALVCNLSMLPYPLWFKIANLLAIPAAMIAAIRWSRKRDSARGTLSG